MNPIHPQQPTTLPTAEPNLSKPVQPSETLIPLEPQTAPPNPDIEIEAQKLIAMFRRDWTSSHTEKLLQNTPSPKELHWIGKNEPIIALSFIEQIQEALNYNGVKDRAERLKLAVMSVHLVEGMTPKKIGNAKQVTTTWTATDDITCAGFVVCMGEILFHGSLQEIEILLSFIESLPNRYPGKPPYNNLLEQFLIPLHDEYGYKVFTQPILNGSLDCDSILILSYYIIKLIETRGNPFKNNKEEAARLLVPVQQALTKKLTGKSDSEKIDYWAAGYLPALIMNEKHDEASAKKLAQHCYQYCITNPQSFDSTLLALCFLCDFSKKYSELEFYDMDEIAKSIMQNPKFMDCTKPNYLYLASLLYRNSPDLLREWFHKEAFQTYKYILHITAPLLPDIDEELYEEKPSEISIPPPTYKEPGKTENMQEYLLRGGHIALLSKLSSLNADKVRSHCNFFIKHQNLNELCHTELADCGLYSLLLTTAMKFGLKKESAELATNIPGMVLTDLSDDDALAIIKSLVPLISAQKPDLNVLYPIACLVSKINIELFKEDEDLKTLTKNTWRLLGLANALPTAAIKPLCIITSHCTSKYTKMPKVPIDTSKLSINSSITRSLVSPAWLPFCSTSPHFRNCAVQLHPYDHEMQQILYDTEGALIARLDGYPFFTPYTNDDDEISDEDPPSTEQKSSAENKIAVTVFEEIERLLCKTKTEKRKTSLSSKPSTPKIHLNPPPEMSPIASHADILKEIPSWIAAIKATLNKDKATQINATLQFTQLCHLSRQLLETGSDEERLEIANCLLEHNFVTTALAYSKKSSTPGSLINAVKTTLTLHATKPNEVKIILNRTDWHSLLCPPPQSGFCSRDPLDKIQVLRLFLFYDNGSLTHIITNAFAKKRLSLIEVTRTIDNSVSAPTVLAWSGLLPDLIKQMNFQEGSSLLIKTRDLMNVTKNRSFWDNESGTAILAIVANWIGAWSSLPKMDVNRELCEVALDLCRLLSNRNFREECYPVKLRDLYNVLLTKVADALYRNSPNENITKMLEKCLRESIIPFLEEQNDQTLCVKTHRIIGKIKNNSNNVKFWSALETRLDKIIDTQLLNDLRLLELLHREQENFLNDNEYQKKTAFQSIKKWEQTAWTEVERLKQNAQAHKNLAKSTEERNRQRKQLRDEHFANSQQVIKDAIDQQYDLCSTIMVRSKEEAEKIASELMNALMDEEDFHRYVKPMLKRVVNWRQGRDPDTLQQKIHKIQLTAMGDIQNIQDVMECELRRIDAYDILSMPPQPSSKRDIIDQMEKNIHRFRETEQQCINQFILEVEQARTAKIIGEVIQKYQWQLQVASKDCLAPIEESPFDIQPKSKKKQQTSKHLEEKVDSLQTQLKEINLALQESEKQREKLLRQLSLSKTIESPPAEPLNYDELLTEISKLVKPGSKIDELIPTMPDNANLWTLRQLQELLSAADFKETKTGTKGSHLHASYEGELVTIANHGKVSPSTPAKAYQVKQTLQHVCAALRK